MNGPATIAAIASPPGAGRRGVVRVSGPGAWNVVRTVWDGAKPLPDGSKRGFHWGRFKDGRGTLPLLLLWMPGPRSFTREDVAEFHLPASPPLMEAALGRILALDVRPAQAGEFTRRAFENGRIDLTRAEGILQLVQARNESERRSATVLLLGGLADRLAPLRDGLAALRSLTEASLDFDEADTGHVPSTELQQMGGRLLEGLHSAARWETRRARAADLPLVALVGAPNAGKSSMFNALVEGGQALVSDASGTTRDVLQGDWRVAGGTVQLVDTAGLNAAAQGPDGQAQRLGRRYLESADVQLWLVDPAGTDPGALEQQWSQLPPAPARILVWTKADQRSSGGAPVADLKATFAQSLHCLEFSSTSGAGRAGLEAALCQVLWGQGTASPRRGGEIGVRHRVALEKATEALETGLEAFALGLPLDQFAEALRGAGAWLDGIHGRTTAEDLLTRIFASFCIGK